MSCYGYSRSRSTQRAVAGAARGARTEMDAPAAAPLGESSSPHLGELLSASSSAAPTPERAECSAADGRARAALELRDLMESVRAATIGESVSTWKCNTASRALVRAIRECDGLEARLGRGSCSTVGGTFLGSRIDSLAEPQRAALHGLPLPPSGVPHAFVVFEGDGSIADVSADQFDGELPPCWFPADPSRYSRQKAPGWTEILAHEAERERGRARASACDAGRCEWWNA